MKIYYALVGLAVSWSAYAGCPRERGETADCQFEQAQVQQALIGTSIYRQFTYCLKEHPGSPDSEGLQCRAPTVYKDSYEFFTDKVFEDRFIYSEVNRMGFLQIYFVKQSNGKYNVYLDSTTDGVLNIDEHIPETDRGAVAWFDSDLRPQFNTVLVRAGTNPPEILGHAEFRHTRYWADITTTNNGKTVRYEAVNGPQEMQLQQVLARLVKKH